MILDVTISDQEHKIELGDIPMIQSVSANGKSIQVIYKYLMGVEDKEWLDRATQEAMGEMISDVDEVVKEAREVIKSARKSIPFKYKVLNVLNNWRQRLK